MHAFLLISGSFAVLLGVLALAAATLPWPWAPERQKDQPSTAPMEYQTPHSPVRSFAAPG